MAFSTNLCLEILHNRLLHLLIFAPLLLVASAYAIHCLPARQHGAVSRIADLSRSENEDLLYRKRSSNRISLLTIVIITLTRSNRALIDFIWLCIDLCMGALASEKGESCRMSSARCSHETVLCLWRGGQCSILTQSEVSEVQNWFLVQDTIGGTHCHSTMLLASKPTCHLYSFYYMLLHTWFKVVQSVQLSPAVRIASADPMFAGLHLEPATSWHCMYQFYLRQYLEHIRKHFAQHLWLVVSNSCIAWQGLHQGTVQYQFRS